MTEIQVTLETVTPARASEWLELNQHNRRPTKPRVPKYAEDMREERWKLSPDCIAFDLKGRLFNGQHRLMAQVQAGVTVQYLVARNMPMDSFGVTDLGIVRSPATIGELAGVAGSSNQFAAAARVMLLVLDAASKGVTTTLRSSSMPTSTAIAAYMEEHQDLLRRALLLFPQRCSVSRPRSIFAGVFAAMLYKLGEAPEVIQFAHEIATGEELSYGDPALALRTAVLNMGTIEGKDGRERKIHLILRAWEARCMGRPMKRLSYAPGHVIAIARP